MSIKAFFEKSADPISARLSIGDGTGKSVALSKRTGAGAYTDLFSFIDSGVVVVSAGITLSAFVTAGIVHNNSSGVFSSSLIVDGDITTATINVNKISGSGATSGQVPSFNGTTVVWTTPAAGAGVVTNVANGLAPLITGANTALISTSGTAAVWGQITGAIIASNTVGLTNLSTSGATSGQIISYNGSSIVWTTPAGGTGFGAADTVYVTNAGASAALWAKLVDANVATAAAIQGTKISPNFGAQTVISTLAYRAGTNPATSGAFNGPTNTALLSSRNASNSGDLPIVTSLATDDFRFGSVNIGTLHYSAATHIFESAAGTTWWTISGQLLSVAPSFTAPTIQQDRSLAGAGRTLTISAQAGQLATNSAGGDLHLLGGTGTGTGLQGVVATVGNTIYSYSANGHVFANQTATQNYWALGGVGTIAEILADRTVTTVEIGQAQPVSGGGASWFVAAQAAASGSNANGGGLNLSGGAGDGAGDYGAVELAGVGILMLTTNTATGIQISGPLTGYSTTGDTLRFGITTVNGVASGNYFLPAAGAATMYIKINGNLTGDFKLLIQLQAGWTKIVDFQGVTFNSHDFSIQGHNSGTPSGAVVSRSSPQKLFIGCDGVDVF